MKESRSRWARNPIFTEEPYWPNGPHSDNKPCERSIIVGGTSPLKKRRVESRAFLKAVPANATFGCYGGELETAHTEYHHSTYRLIHSELVCLLNEPYFPSLIAFPNIN